MRQSNNLTIKIIIAQMVLYVLLFFSFNNKTFFPPIILFALYLFWLLEDWRQAAWLTLVAVFPFGWALRSLRAPVAFPFYFSTYTERGVVGGKEIFFGLSFTAKFMILVFLLLAVAFKRKIKISLERKDIFLFFSLFLGLISVSVSQNPILAATALFGIFLAIALYYLARYFLADRSLFLLTIYSLFTLVFFEGIWASLQFLLKRPLGRILELELAESPYGILAAEDIFQFRSSGTLVHPNTLAIFLGMLLPLIMTQLMVKKPLIKNKILVLTSFLFGLFGLVFTMSRWAWVVSGFALVGLFYYLIRREKLKFSKKLVSIFLILLVIFIPLSGRRILTSGEVFEGKYSTWQSRSKLVQEALVMIREKPLFGVGPGNFLPILAQNDVTGVAHYFFAPVHNLYLLFASELGILALIAFLSFVFLSIKETIFGLGSYSRTRFFSIRVGLLAGILSYLLLILIYTGMGINFELFCLLLGTLGAGKGKI